MTIPEVSRDGAVISSRRPQANKASCYKTKQCLKGGTGSRNAGV